jgi:hypothetical protein
MFCIRDLTTSKGFETMLAAALSSFYSRKMRPILSKSLEANCKSLEANLKSKLRTETRARCRAEEQWQTVEHLPTLPKEPGPR